MISLLRGKLLEVSPSMALVDVGGVGFELGVSSITAASLPTPGQDCLLYTRLQVREDALTLFGFATSDERMMFDKLIAVSGVGPRLALAVLSRFSVGELYAIVMAEDEKGMSSVSGVGKKTAQRLILELKSVFAKGMPFASAPATASCPVSVAPAAPLALEEARAALLSMGFSGQEAELALDGLEDSSGRVEELLGAALRRLGMDS